MNKHTSFVMKPGEAAVRFRVQVAAEDAHALVIIEILFFMIFKFVDNLNLNYHYQS